MNNAHRLLQAVQALMASAQLLFQNAGDIERQLVEEIRASENAATEAEASGGPAALPKAGDSQPGARVESQASALSDEAWNKAVGATGEDAPFLCRLCGATIFLRGINGRRIPTDPDGTNHRTTCRGPGEARRRRGR